ncbi:MAG: hypothetical protein K2Y18_02785 [Alphaproteobacteria bacterium]|jgi:hypothetical protein|nr:hypothetical protein [Alphaproteobacteria bacterium]
MIDEFFQQKPNYSTGALKGRTPFLFRSLFYTALIGFISGFFFGYLYMGGWIPTAEKGLILYGATFAVGVIFSTTLALYQVRANQLKGEKVRKTSKP